MKIQLLAECPRCHKILHYESESSGQYVSHIFTATVLPLDRKFYWSDKLNCWLCKECMDQLIQLKARQEQEVKSFIKEGEKP